MSRWHETGRAKRSAALLAAAIPLGLPSPSLARTGTCEPVRIAPRQATLPHLPGSWRAALEALARATRQEGLPWSCSGGSVELALDPSGGAELTVTDAEGRAVSRHVANADEVVPTGEALLAAPIEEVGPVPPVAAPSEPPPVEKPKATSSEPRAQIQLAIGPRYSGPGAMAWGSTRLGLQLPFGEWSVGFWARYDLHLAGPTGNWVNFETSSVSAALSAARRLVSKPFELRVTLDPSISAVLMEAGYEDQPHPEGAKVAFRLGTSLSGIFPIAGIFRGVVTVDGEFAPAGIAGLGNIDTQNRPPQLPPVPVYTAGILLGVEASIR